MSIETTFHPANEVARATAEILAGIGERIRTARLAQGMTLQSLAAAANLSPSMLSLVERGRATPSIGSLVVIANCLGVAMSDLIAPGPPANPGVVVRVADQQIVETANHVVRRIIREDRVRGVSIAINEYQPNTGNSDQPVSHDGYEYGIVLEGTLTSKSTARPSCWRAAISSRTAPASRTGSGITPRKRCARSWFNLQRD